MRRSGGVSRSTVSTGTRREMLRHVQKAGKCQRFYFIYPLKSDSVVSCVIYQDDPDGATKKYFKKTTTISPLVYCTSMQYEPRGINIFTWQLFDRTDALQQLQMCHNNIPIFDHNMNQDAQRLILDSDYTFPVLPRSEMLQRV